MTQTGGNIAGIQSLRYHNRGGGVPETIKDDRPQAVCLYNLLKLLSRKGDIQTVAQSASKNRIRFRPVSTKKRSCSLELLRFLVRA